MNSKCFTRALLLVMMVALTIKVNFAQQSNEYEILLKEDGIENAYPRLSLDGKKILYQSNRTGKWQLYIMDISTKAQERITNDSFNNNFQDWSPDNKWIAFVSDREGNEEVYLMKSDGSDLKRLTNDPGRDIHPYFSPDSKYILFNSTKEKESFDIYRYTIATGKIEQLTNSDDDETCARYSPDMKSMVLLRNNMKTDDVFVMNTSNFLMKNVSNTSTYEHGWPVFSNDGKWVYYSSMEGGTYSIYRIRPDGSERQQLTQAKYGEDDARVNVANDQSWMIYNKKVGKTIMICSAPIN
jgi:TolB protein